MRYDGTTREIQGGDLFEISVLRHQQPAWFDTYVAVERYGDERSVCCVAKRYGAWHQTTVCGPDVVANL